MPDKKKKTEYLQFRIAEDDKETIEQGAAFRGLDVSEYIRMQALNAARKDIQSSSKVVLSEEEWDTLLEIIESPMSNPNRPLQAAFESLSQAEQCDPEYPLENFG